MLTVYSIYLITNNLNGKTYIGKHKCDKNEEPESRSYMGSGINIRNAESKYGIENFSKEILAICYFEDECNILEKEYIKLYRSINKAEYNIADGGYGGNTTMGCFWYTNGVDNILSKNCPEGYYKGISGRKPLSEETKKKMSETLKGRPISEEHRRKCSLVNIGRKWFNNGINEKFLYECPEGYVEGRIPIGTCWNKGKTNCFSKETIEKMRNSSCRGKHYYNNGIIEVREYICPEGFEPGRLKIERKSTTGYHWYNDGVTNVSAKECPEGFHPGRIISWEIFDLNANKK